MMTDDDDDYDNHNDDVFCMLQLKLLLWPLPHQIQKSSPSPPEFLDKKQNFAKLL